jgi:hypothetical protein
MKSLHYNLLHDFEQYIINMEYFNNDSYDDIKNLLIKFFELNIGCDRFSNDISVNYVTPDEFDIHEYEFVKNVVGLLFMYNFADKLLKLLNDDLEMKYDNFNKITTNSFALYMIDILKYDY